MAPPTRGAGAPGEGARFLVGLARSGVHCGRCLLVAVGCPLGPAVLAPLAPHPREPTGRPALCQSGRRAVPEPPSAATPCLRFLPRGGPQARPAPAARLLPIWECHDRLSPRRCSTQAAPKGATTMSTATPAEVIPSPRTGQEEVRVYFHSPILYWWPAWAAGLLMALWTALD